MCSRLVAATAERKRERDRDREFEEDLLYKALAAELQWRVREAAEKEVKTKTKREEGFRLDSMRGYAHNGPYTSNPGRCLFQRSGLDMQQKCSKTPKPHNKHTKMGKRKNRADFGSLDRPRDGNGPIRAGYGNTILVLAPHLRLFPWPHLWFSNFEKSLSPYPLGD